MASYIDQVLINDERVIYRARLSKWSMWPQILFGALLVALSIVGLLLWRQIPFGVLFVPLFVGLVLWLWAWIVYATTELAITNKRVIAKTGMIERRTTEMFLEKIESIQVDQSILGRLFDFGSVVISGTGVHSAPFKNISDPLALRRSFMMAADARQRTS
jgi:uncharacterized membrane protein YdbT with pleckstrin-like domain